ncbi:MAG: penicillin-binding protein activator [Nevskia sp.]|nr:penicillin-binding protein activator [Nevskia sp.]
MISPRFFPLASLFLTAFSGVLGGCASSGFGESTGAYMSSANAQPANSAADSAAQHGDYLHAARSYLDAAANAKPAEALELRLRAAEAAANGNDFNLAGTLIAQLPASAMSPDQQLRGRIVNARAALARNDAATALRWLPVDPGLQPSAERALAVRARALFVSGDTVGGTQAMVLRERYLHDAAALGESRNQLWIALTTATLDANTLARAGSAEPITRGWIELANLARRNAPLSFYNNWRQRYPAHPGEQQLAALMMPGAPVPGGVAPTAPFAAVPSAPSVQAPTVMAGSGFTAMLLPQTGPVAAVGDAVRAGYSAAAARAGNTTPPQVFDVSSAATPLAGVAQQAASAGAGLIVGPLLKESVVSLSQLGQPPVPVLALNYLDPNHPAPSGFYQFGLAPEDEARAAAEDASSRGLKRALVLVQSGEWGARVAAAFQQRLLELGGIVVDSDRYSGAQESWSDPVKRLLRYRAIDDRKQAAEARAKAQPGIDPQRRNDFDFIFLGARSQDNARLLWPLFRFYHAERIAIYATAAVNSGNGDRDVAGIRFCDAPWLLDNSGRFAAFHDEALNGRSNDSARLYALGADTYLLAQRMAQGGLRAGDQIPAATGNLGVGNDGAIHRGLVCARLSFGPPVLLRAGADVGAADDDPATP